MWKTWGNILFIKIHEFNFCFRMIEYFYGKACCFSLYFLYFYVTLILFTTNFLWEC